MKLRIGHLVSTLIHNESGQTLPIAALMMVVLLGMVGLVVDVGHVYLCHRELQASSDAAALAGAEVIPTAISVAAVQAKAIAYSASPGGVNTYNNMSNVSMVSGYPVLKCLSSMQAQGISCVGQLQYNAIQVMQQATVNLNFAWIVGKPSMTITAAATAAKGGASSRPYNIALVMDTTLSENNYDSDCGNTQMLCTLNGVQVLLNHLDPCGTSQTTCSISGGQSTNSVVRVGIFTFPAVTYGTAANDSDCSLTTPTAVAYNTFPVPGAGAYSPGTSSNTSTYRLLDFQSDYRLSDTATVLNPNSALTYALGAVNGCPGMGPALNAGNYGTYYPATIYAAQAALIQEQTQFPDSQNVMIIIGDGDNNAPHCNPDPFINPQPSSCAGGSSNVTPMGGLANATGVYPSYYGECSQSITAANFATAQGTRVYTVAYGSPATGCVWDQSGYGHATGAYPNVLPCNELALMASASYYFFSDFKQTGSGSVCTAAQVMVELSDIFLQIAGDLTVARLIPNSTT